MADKKISEPPDFVKGLLKSADETSKLLDPNKVSPRDLLTKLEDGRELKKFSPEERQELGIYQARVVLMVLAAELALKFLWQHVQSYNTKPKGTGHNLSLLFSNLPHHYRVDIQSEYCKRATSPPDGWETPGKIFELCKSASVQWRYLVEKNNFPKYVMQAKYLKYATLSVLEIAEGLALENEAT